MKIGLDDALVSGMTVPDLYALAVDDLPPLHTGRTIETNNRQLPDISADGLDALRVDNDPPKTYVMAGRFVRIHKDEMGRATIDPLCPYALRGILARTATWISTSEKRGVVNVAPPIQVVEDILALGEYPGFPPLTGIATAPTFGPDGMLGTAPGYHHATKTYYHAPAELKLPDTEPTPENVQAAVKLLAEELFGDFAFADAASRAHAIAYTILPFVRAMIPGPTPVHMFDAPKAGTGKTLCVDVATMIFGLDIPLHGAPEDKAEWDKVLITAFASGSSHLIFDNVRLLDSDKYLLGVTASAYASRLLGTNTQGTFPVRLIWAVTCNNLVANDELTRRSILIRLDSGVENPDERSGFRHPDLIAWVKQNRPQLIGAVLTVVRAWIAKGKPEYAGPNPPLGKFEAWTRVMGGILEAAGIPGFLDNREALKQRADNDSSAWRAFVGAWKEAHGTEKVLSAELFPLAQEWLADKLGDGTDRSQQTRFGKLLSKNVDRVYAGMKIVRAGEATCGKSKGAALFQLQPTEPGNMGNIKELFLTPHEKYQGFNNDTLIGRLENLPPSSDVPLQNSGPVVLTATPTQIQMAQAIGQLRKTGHDHTRKAHEDAGSDAENLSRDYFGTLAEICVRQWLETNGITPEATLYAERAVEEPDLQVNGVTFDVKAARPSQRYNDSITINQETHHKPKKPAIDYYLPVLFTDDRTMRLYAPVPYKAVDMWHVNTGHSLFYYPPSGYLTPLCTIDQIRTLTTPKEEAHAAPQWK